MDCVQGDGVVGRGLAREEVVRLKLFIVVQREGVLHGH